MDDKYECMHTDTAANGQQLSKPSKKQSQYFLNGCSRQQNLLRRPCDDHESVISSMDAQGSKTSFADLVMTMNLLTC